MQARLLQVDDVPQSASVAGGVGAAARRAEVCNVAEQSVAGDVPAGGVGEDHDECLLVLVGEVETDAATAVGEGRPGEQFAVL